MSKILKKFEKAIFEGCLYRKLFQTQTPGKRIAPAQAKDNDSKLQLRLDAGESQNGMKNVYLQVNSEAKNDKLAKFRQKEGTHAKLASGTIDENTPAKSQKKVAKGFWKNVSKEAKEKLG